MVDMYALGQNNYGNDLGHSHQASQMQQPSAANQTEYGHFGVATQPPLPSSGSVDHIARNAFISSQYKYMNGIRS